MIPGVPQITSRIRDGGREYTLRKNRRVTLRMMVVKANTRMTIMILSHGGCYGDEENGKNSFLRPAGLLLSGQTGDEPMASLDP